MVDPRAPRNRHRHVVGEGRADRLRSADRRVAERAAQRRATACRLVGAGSRKLGLGDGRGDRRALPRPAGGPEARARHRPLRSDARGHADRRRRPSTAPLHPVERRALGAGSGGARRRPAVPGDHGQHRVSRLHGAEARLDSAPRAGDLRQGRQGAPAQGLRAALAFRRLRLRHVGLLGHGVARRGEARLV